VYAYKNTSCVVRPVVYKDSDNTVLSYGAEVTLPTSAGWRDMTCGGTVVASTDYMLGIWIGPNGCTWYYDTVTGYYLADATLTYHSTNAPTSPITWDGGKPYMSNREFWIYATYTQARRRNFPIWI
jgi:hypothetical protein